MKKSRLLITCLCAVCLALGIFAGCGAKEGGGSKSGRNYKVTATLSDYSVDLAGARYLGIRSASALSGVKAATLSSSAEEAAERPVLVKQTGGAAEEITFKLNGKELTQDGAGVEIYQMTVQDGFTYVSFISSDVRERLTAEPYKDYVIHNFDLLEDELTFYLYEIKTGGEPVYLYDRLRGVPENFDNKNFATNDYIKSYAVHNKTGKIYAMDSLPSFDVQDGLIVSKANRVTKAYRPIVKGSGELVLTDVLPNPGAKIEQTYRDADGTIYIFNSAIEQNDGDGYVYIKLDNSYDLHNYCTGPDGRLYAYDSYIDDPTHSYVDGVKTPLSMTARFSGLRSLAQSVPKIEGLVDGYGVFSSPSCEPNSLWVGEFYSTNGAGIKSSRGTWFNGGVDYVIMPSDDGLYSIPLTYAKEDRSLMVTPGTPVKLLGACTMRDIAVLENGKVRVYENAFSVVSLTATKRYAVVPDAAGKPSVRLLSDTPVDPSNIIIAPLN